MTSSAFSPSFWKNILLRILIFILLLWLNLLVWEYQMCRMPSHRVINREMLKVRLHMIAHYLAWHLIHQHLILYFVFKYFPVLMFLFDWLLFTLFLLSSYTLWYRGYLTWLLLGLNKMSEEWFRLNILSSTWDMITSVWKLLLAIFHDRNPLTLSIYFSLHLS